MTKPESRGEAAAAAASGLRAWLAARGWTRVALVLLAFAIGAGSFVLGWALREPPRLSAVSYGGERIFAINAHLATAPPGYVYLAGDSYMELYRPEALPCGREIVNGGVGGAKAGEYLRFLDLIRLQPPPAAILLSVGLNNLLKKSNPSGSAALAAFRDAADALIRRLGEGGAKVVVVAIPPVAKDTAKFFDVEAIETYTNALRGICAKRGCQVRDVFAEARDGVFWRAKPGLAPDGIHLADLRRYYRKVYDELCT
jgi:lysophospholipase L1-like esterase